MGFSEINLCAGIVKKQLPIESGALWMPAVLVYILKTVKYPAGVPISRVGQDGKHA